MPEHETFDLDAAFAALEQDISTLVSSPGARAAMARARRRRRTTVGAIAAGAVLAVGGVAIGQGLSSRDQSVAPTDQLPTPALLDGPHLSAATQGWTPAWSTNNQEAHDKMGQTFGGDCLMIAPRGRSGVAVLGNSHGDVATALMSDYGADAAEEQRDWRAMERRLAACSGAQLVSSFSDPSGVEGHTYRISATQSETAPQYEWIVSTGQGIGVLKIFDQSDELPAANDRPVAQALTAALESDASFSEASPAGRVGQATPEQLAFFGSARLRHALSGWQSGWHDGPPPTALLHEPCGSDGWNGTGKDTNLGTDGRYWIHQFPSPTAADTGYQHIQDALGQCPGVTARTVSAPGGSTVLVARGDDDVWAVRHDDWVVVTYLPRAATPPPDAVSAAMGSAMVGVVNDDLASSHK